MTRITMVGYDQVMSPKMSTLLKNPDYRAYFRRSLKYPSNIYHPEPWRVWVQRVNGRWASKTFKEFPDAFAFAKTVLARPADFQDVSISSRLLGFRAPEQLRAHYQSEGYSWCVMCRRPVDFVPMRRHHALRNDLHRYYAHFPVCPYCGIREETTLTRGAITYGKG